MSTAPTRPKVLLTAGQTLTVDQVDYVAQLEARARRLVELVDVDLADELNVERTRALNHRRHAAELKAELRHAQMVGRWLRHRNQRLLALLRTIQPPRKENTMTMPDIERLQALDLQPGDILVVTLPEHATFEAIDMARAHLKREFPAQQVLVVTRGVDLAAYRPVPIEAQEATTDA